jgi:hypothetical protein
MTKRPVTTYHLIAVLVVCFTLAAMSLLISLRVNRNTEEKFCATAVTWDRGYREVPPQTQSGRNQARNAADLVKRLHCTPEGSLKARPPSGVPSSK